MTSPSHGEDLVFESRRAHLFFPAFRIHLSALSLFKISSFGSFYIDVEYHLMKFELFSTGTKGGSIFCFNFTIYCIIIAIIS